MTAYLSTQDQRKIWVETEPTVPNFEGPISPYHDGHGPIPTSELILLASGKRPHDINLETALYNTIHTIQEVLKHQVSIPTSKILSFFHGNHWHRKAW
jgi:hypothetical protein